LAAHDGSPLPSIQQLGRNSAALSDQTLLILAVKKHDIHVLEWLLKDGFKVQEKDSSQRSALHWACFLGRNDMAELLVRYGARLDERDAELQTPVDLALETSGVAVGMSLVQVLAQVQQKQSPRIRETALALACHLGQLTIVEAMIETGAGVNERGVNTPLELALRDATWPLVQVLLCAGAYTNTITHHHRVLLMNRRDGFLVGGGGKKDYADAENKIMLLKGYGLDVDASPSPTPSTGLELTIPSKQPWLHRI
jgi:ankyrin repeat protein